MSAQPGGNGGGQTITDMFRKDAYDNQTLGILRKMVNAVNEASLPTSALPDVDLFNDDGKGTTEMPRLQRGPVPEQIQAQNSPVAVAAKTATGSSSSNEAQEAVSAMRDLVKANIEPQAVQETAVHHEEEHDEPEHNEEQHEVAQEFDLFQFG